MTHELGPLPDPFDYCYEWDGPYGTRKFSVAPHNGRKPDRSVPIYRSDQLRAYALAEVQKAVLAERERLTRGKLWLWRNHVDGRPEYWAFTNPYPINMDNGDPQTLGQPCGYAIFKPSRDGSNGRTEAQVLAQMTAIRKGEA